KKPQLILVGELMVMRYQRSYLRGCHIKKGADYVSVKTYRGSSGQALRGIFPDRRSTTWSCDLRKSKGFVGGADGLLPGTL
ncbi:MAG TPA: hypothetical protein VLM19_05555, partial [Nitrospiraceae bacterium]|nr:hypothetical protein [Nitrospiraceae bacterium]